MCGYVVKRVFVVKLDPIRDGDAVRPTPLFYNKEHSSTPDFILTLQDNDRKTNGSDLSEWFTDAFMENTFLFLVSLMQNVNN